MDFWGRRVNETFALDRVIPPLKGLSREELHNIASHAFIPLDVRGARQFIVSLRYGDLVRREELLDALSGGSYVRTSPK